MAEDVALPTPVAASVNELYKHAKAAGLGDQDFSAVIEAFELDPKRSNH
jgi:3-hydroxyisobutyrate dehydrogenase-like beta-hydroxyacid dehydrogenase